MATDVLVFDTTLRDGEQAPGFSLRVPEKLALARRLEALGVDIIEAGFPIASVDDAESVRRIAHEVQGPTIAALARCTARRHRMRRQGHRPRPQGAHPHLHRHVRPASRAQAAHLARAVPRDGRQGRRPGPSVHRRCAVLGRGRDAQRPAVPDAGRSRRSSPPAPPRSTCRTRSATRRPTRSATTSRRSSRPCRGSDEVDLQHALSRRPRTRGGQQHRGACTAARGRWSARSTASASAPATPRSRSS